MSAKLRLAVVILACLAVPGVVVAAPPTPGTPGAAGIGDPYYPLDGNGGYNISHYDLNLTYEPATHLLTGVETITARATQALSTFNLDFVGLRLRSVTVNGTHAVTSRTDHELTVTPRNTLANGALFTVVARYDGSPQTLEDFGGSGFLYTNDGAIVAGQPHGAATWFPANDHPRDKASFTTHITVPAGLEAISNGVLTSHTTSGGSTTWNWDAVEPMATYLLTMAIGQFEVRDYQAAGIKYWDAIDPDLLPDRVPAVLPTGGARLLYSDAADMSYKRLTRTISVPPGGALLSFQAYRETEPDWDFLFVEARTAGGTDWTTLPDLNGHTTQEVGACPYNYLDLHPFLEHYVTPVVVDEGDPNDPFDDFYSCDPTGTTGAWNARSGFSDGWEAWSVELPNAGTTTRRVEVSIAYASDWSVQYRGVGIDDIVVSTGQGSTGFEGGGNVMNGWVAPIAGPEGSPDNFNTWILSDRVPEIPGMGANALQSFDRQPEILAFEASKFGPYPFASAGGIVDLVDVGFALETQTRVVYSQYFFDGGPNDWVVVHELAHQWYGDNLAVDTWQNIWLNEGFATYAEWLWSEEEGGDTPAQIFDFFVNEVPADDGFWDLAIGDPGTDCLFCGEVYARGALTLQALREEVGSVKFFQILQAWSASQAGGTVTTREFIDLAESIARQDLDPLFDVWLSSGKPPVASTPGGGAAALKKAPAAVRDLAERLQERGGRAWGDSRMFR